MRVAVRSLVPVDERQLLAVDQDLVRAHVAVGEDRRHRSERRQRTAKPLDERERARFQIRRHQHAVKCRRVPRRDEYRDFGAPHDMQTGAAPEPALEGGVMLAAEHHEPRPLFVHHLIQHRRRRSKRDLGTGAEQLAIHRQLPGIEVDV